MNWKNILILALFVTVLFGCYDEDKIVPLEPGEGMVRYEFPQGENAWDQDIVEISEQFGVYLIYKDYKEKGAWDCTSKTYFRYTIPCTL